MTPWDVIFAAVVLFIAGLVGVRIQSRSRDRSSSQSSSNPSVVIIDQARRRADEQLDADVQEVEDAARGEDPLINLTERARKRHRKENP